MPARQVRGVLRLERVGHVVAFELFLGVVEQRRDVGAAFEVGEAQRAAAAQDAGPVAPPGSASSQSSRSGEWVEALCM